MSQLIVKTFSATMAKDRDRLGDEVTEWIEDQDDFHVVEIRTIQSSDNAYHCLTIIVFGRRGKEEVPTPPKPTRVPSPGDGAPR